jgi:hypothetical protein
MAWAFALKCMWRLQRVTAERRGKEAWMQRVKNWVSLMCRPFVKFARSLLAAKTELGDSIKESSDLHWQG